MRKRISQLVLMVLAALPSAHGQGYFFARSDAGGGGATYLIDQDFEGAGYDNGETWTESGSTIDEDYTSVVLDGSQSLRVNLAISGSTYAVYTAKDEVWVYCLMRPITIDTGGTFFIVTINTGATVLAGIRMRSDSILQVLSTFTASPTDTLSTGTTYHVWLHYKKGTGANGIADVGFSTNGVRPTSGTATYAEITNSDKTAQADRVVLGTPGGATHQYIFDKVRVDDVQIGDNPD